MSIQSEITRISGNVSDSLDAVSAKGVTVPSGSNSDDLAGLIAQITSSPTLQTKSKSYTPTESAQSETITADSGYDGLGEVDVSVGAISSTYVGSGITRRSSTDMTASGATVTVPAGYYASSASKSVASGTAGTPTATKGTVSNHSVSVTPSVTNTSGYITGSTKTGTAVSVSASELVSGNKAITSNGTNIDVANYSTCSVNVGSSIGTSTSGTASVGTSSNSYNVYTFTGLLGEPLTFTIARSQAVSTTSQVATVVYNGTDTHTYYLSKSGSTYRVGYGTAGFTYSSGTLKITASAGIGFATSSGGYKLVYAY